MNCQLESGELLRLEGGRKGIVLYCQKGTVWITIGDGVDRLCHPGSNFAVPAGSTAIAEALGSAEVRLAPVPSSSARPVLIRQTCGA